MMLYPVYVHKDKTSAYGLTFPDFPGCFSAADEIEGITRAAQEAVEAHFDGEAMEIPAPSIPEKWSRDKRFKGGYWMLVEIDLERVSNKSVRLNISLPERLVVRIDAFAKSRHLSRSAFLARAAMAQMRTEKPA